MKKVLITSETGFVANHMIVKKLLLSCKNKLILIL